MIGRQPPRPLKGEEADASLFYAAKIPNFINISKFSSIFFFLKEKRCAKKGFLNGF